MKILLGLIFLFYHLVSFAQTYEERIQKFMDTLNMGGSYLIGNSMPAFEIKSTDGYWYTNENLIGKITFINFWFEACPPCIVEMNALEQLYNKYKQNGNFQFLSITYEKIEAIEKISEKYKMSYPVLSTSRDSCYYLNFRKGFPTTIIVDGNSKIVFFTFGGNTDPKLANIYFRDNLYPLLNCMLK
jgi:peroxiredoxin